ncbi:RICIN domain-containing protein [Streptomyces sp. NPDC050516]|uniref:RICIN domain-containing protein n=1 Tax=Streptomyces sp. NPDC050516 TaxID=3365621 RepID=UPI003796AC5B
MPILPDGEYLIKNAAEDLYVDVSGGSPHPNTPIIGWPLSKEPNQKWRLTCINGINEFHIKSSLSTGEPFFALSALRIFPPRIAVQPFPERWSIEPVGEHLFRIAFPYMDGVVTLPDGQKGTQLTVQPFEGLRFQKWTFEQA